MVLFGSYPWTIDKKSVIQQKVAELFPDIKWLYEENGEVKKENYDATDSYTALLGWLNYEKYGELEFKIDEIGAKSSPKEHQIIIDYDVHYWGKTEHRTTYIDTKK